MKKVSEDTSRNTWTTSELMIEGDCGVKPALWINDQRSECNGRPHPSSPLGPTGYGHSLIHRFFPRRLAHLVHFQRSARPGRSFSLPLCHVPGDDDFGGALAAYVSGGLAVSGPAPAGPGNHRNGGQPGPGVVRHSRGILSHSRGRLQLFQPGQSGGPGRGRPDGNPGVVRQNPHPPGLDQPCGPIRRTGGGDLRIDRLFFLSLCHHPVRQVAHPAQ